MSGPTPGSAPSADEQAVRQAVVDAMQTLDRLGLNRGSTGNASVRLAREGVAGMLITPTGTDAERLQPGDLCWVGVDGRVEGPWAPSSESLFHQAAYRVRDDIGAVLHTHAEHATAVACLGGPLPAFHYMVAIAGGADVPLVPYHGFGSRALADGVAAALAERQACLLAQHGLVTVGASMADALKVMREIESLCRTYLLARSAGQPPILDAGEMARVVEKFSSYGQKRRTG